RSYRRSGCPASVVVVTTRTAEPVPEPTTAWGYGLATITEDGRVLDTWYPSPALGRPSGEPSPPADLDALAGKDDRRRVRTEVVLGTADLTAPPADARDAYLRLHLLSHRLVRPHGANLDGIFGVLANVVWTNHGPCAPDDFEQTRLRLRTVGAPVSVYGVDK